MSGPGDFLNLAIAQTDNSVREGGGFEAVGCHDGGGLEFAGEAPEKLEDEVASDGVEIAGGLVREKNRGGLHESAGDANALHLAAGELVRITAGEAIEFDGSDFLERGFADFRLACELQGQLDVFENSKRVEQLEGLKNEADFIAAEGGERGVVQGGGGDAIQQDGAESGEIHGSGEIEKSGLAAAAAAHKGDKFAATHLQRNVLQGEYRLAIGDVVFADVLEGNDGRHGGLSMRFRTLCQRRRLFSNGRRRPGLCRVFGCGFAGTSQNRQRVIRAL